MTIPFIPAIDPSIKQSAERLIQLVGRTVKPYAETEHQLAEAFRTNPQVLQAYADFAANNPDAVRNLMGDRVSAFLRNVPESPTSRLQRSQVDYQRGIVDARREALQKLSPETLEQLAGVGAAVDVGGMKPSEATNEINTQQAQTAFSTYAKVNPNFNARDFVRNFRTGAKDAAGNPLVDFDVMTGALQSPSGATIRLLMEEMDREDEQKFRKDLNDADNAARRTSLFESNVLSAAERLFVNSGGRGTVQAWESYSSNPAARKRAIELAGLPDSEAANLNLSPEDQALRQVGLGAGQLQEKFTQPARGRLRLYQDNIRRLAVDRKANKIKREEYETQLVNLVNLMNNDLDLAGADYRAEIEQITDNLITPNRTGVVFKRADGTIVNPDLSNDGSNTPNPSRARASSEIQGRANQLIANARSAIGPNYSAQRAIADLNASDELPEVKRIVTDSLRAR